jgi:hypothetical protein
MGGTEYKKAKARHKVSYEDCMKTIRQTLFLILAEELTKLAHK